MIFLCYLHLKQPNNLQPGILMGFVSHQTQMCGSEAAFHIGQQGWPLCSLLGTFWTNVLFHFVAPVKVFFPNQAVKISCDSTQITQTLKMIYGLSNVRAFFDSFCVLLYKISLWNHRCYFTIMQTISSIYLKSSL